MAKLSEEVQEYIVQAHACWRKPSLIVKDVKAEFGVDVTRQQVNFYHPEKGGRTNRLAEKHKKLFEETREAVSAEKVKSAVESRYYRLELYRRGIEYYEEMGNYVLAKDLAETAAKDLGGAFTNKRELTGRDGKPLLPESLAASILKVYGAAGDTGGGAGGDSQ